VRGCFVTGTDTSVGKTLVAAALAATLVERGVRVHAFKPVITGLEEDRASGWPRDHELLGAVTGQELEEVAPVGFGPAVSPHLAAELAGEPIDFDGLVRAARAAASGVDALIVEGAGGLLVPLSPGRSVRDLAAALDLPLVIAARPGLGTINHTLLTLEAARAVGLRIAGVALTPWPEEPTVIERSNRQTIEQLGEVEVAGLPLVRPLDSATLAAAGGHLPGEWLA